MTYINILILLILAHFVADFVLQNDRMAVEKCPGKDVVLHWTWWMAGHTALHGLFVAVITGIPLLGLAEWIIHFAIDYGKCRGYYNLGMDQAFHIFCKMLWVAFLYDTL
jgi:hypothetical protein